ncbi:hypothetical protein CONLIGDRAFT_674546 [Coniochaeta ligniaria NRRL 30616]|uniref:Uncharacterized protein n=1 Tax=Coniochaeta ligniaria NRRL 30616 TaxID=1408157 RepID=A0A1J7J032_9PEZI|nr:hypothetical protein CONLIGDRAFT_674546 [Coniochaeta ligniaria NRRL 30616]
MSDSSNNMDDSKNSDSKQSDSKHSDSNLNDSSHNVSDHSDSNHKRPSKASRKRARRRARPAGIPDWIQEYKNKSQLWTPEAWHTKRDEKDPKTRWAYLVVGGDSVFPNAEAVRDFYQLPATPRTENTTTSDAMTATMALLEDRSNERPVTVCIITATHAFDMEFRTHGSRVNAWLEDTLLRCWCPTAFREEGTDSKGGHDKENGHRAARYETNWQDFDGVVRESPMPLRWA